EEVGRLQVRREVLLLDVHAGDLGRASEDGSLPRLEPGAHLMEFAPEVTGEVPDLESDRGMNRVQGPGPDRQALPGVSRDGHLHSSLSAIQLTSQATVARKDCPVKC